MPLGFSRYTLENKMLPALILFIWRYAKLTSIDPKNSSVQTVTVNLENIGSFFSICEKIAFNSNMAWLYKLNTSGNLSYLWRTIRKKFILKQFFTGGTYL